MCSWIPGAILWMKKRFCILVWQMGHLNAIFSLVYFYKSVMCWCLENGENEEKRFRGSKRFKIHDSPICPFFNQFPLLYTTVFTLSITVRSQKETDSIRRSVRPSEPARITLKTRDIRLPNNILYWRRWGQTENKTKEWFGLPWLTMWFVQDF